MNIIQLKKELCFILLIVLTIPSCSKDSLNKPEETLNEADIYLDNVRQVIRGFGAANILP